MLSANELRQKYLSFFQQHGHAILPSASLVPENDPSTLFTSSGMQPLVPYLLGQPHPMGKRLVDSQKSFRSQDIEEVGDNRHTTFFEMLGNWSLGDYFKQEQLRWCFTFLTQEIGLDPQRLFVTVFRGSPALNIPKDQESVTIWQTLFKEAGVPAMDIDFAERDGLQDGRIFYYDERKNWWSRSGVPANMPVGEPGGPDSEVFYDFGTQLGLHEKSAFAAQPCHVNCDCGRFLEIGNSVFMQYQKQADGSFKELPQKNVDFGGGLERILAALHHDPDVFKTDLFWPIIEEIEKVTGRKYDEDGDVTAAFRVIADHLKAATFLIVDGVRPSNKLQGYVLRRLLRRSLLKLRGLQKITNEADANSICEKVLEIYKEKYFENREYYQLVNNEVGAELLKFDDALNRGLKEIEKIPNLNGEIAFRLFERYGFPLELTQEIAQEKNQKINVADFKNEFDRHREVSRTASAGMFKGGLADHSEITTKYHTATHLLHAALRKILGKHVQQKGSNITVERLRFDFAHPVALSESEKKQVEAQINDWIAADLPVTVESLPKQKALESGAVAFFAEKYPNEVTVYTIGQDAQRDWVSKELCGGPHVKRTSEIGPIQIVKEQSAAAGVRRIYIQLQK